MSIPEIRMLIWTMLFAFEARLDDPLTASAR
jgi:hypothetical protein